MIFLTRPIERVHHVHSFAFFHMKFSTCTGNSMKRLLGHRMKKKTNKRVRFQLKLFSRFAKHFVLCNYLCIYVFMSYLSIAKCEPSDKNHSSKFLKWTAQVSSVSKNSSLHRAARRRDIANERSTFRDMPPCQYKESLHLKMARFSTRCETTIKM